jgi:hypothetical protein
MDVAAATRSVRWRRTAAKTGRKQEWRELRLRVPWQFLSRGPESFKESKARPIYPGLAQPFLSEYWEAGTEAHAQATESWA